jgi:hypothetical protein
MRIALHIPATVEQTGERREHTETPLVPTKNVAGSNIIKMTIFINIAFEKKVSS